MPSADTTIRPGTKVLDQLDWTPECEWGADPKHSDCDSTATHVVISRISCPCRVTAVWVVGCRRCGHITRMRVCDVWEVRPL